jgi:hypothetical protein
LLAGAGSEVIATWLGSYYPTDQQAAQRVADAVQNFTSKGFTDRKCQPPYPPCDVFSFHINPLGTDVMVVYTIFALDNAVGEVVIFGEAGIMNSNLSSAFNDAAGLFLAGHAALQAASQSGSPGPQPTATSTSAPSVTSTPLPTATATSVGVTPTPTATPTATSTPIPPQPFIAADRVALMHTVKGHLRTTTVLKSHEKGLFLVAYHVLQAGTASPSMTVTFLRGGTAVRTVTGKPYSMNDGNSYFAVRQAFTAHGKRLHLTAHFTLVLGPSTDTTRSLSFTVKPTAG